MVKLRLKRCGRKQRATIQTIRNFTESKIDEYKSSNSRTTTDY